MKANKKNSEAILSRVERFGDCWIWKGSPTSKGYGELAIGGRRFLAHRVSFEIFRRTIPEGLLVLHTCDVPLCVNPSHLFLGTNADNLKDASRKGRLNPTSLENLVPQEGRFMRLDELKRRRGRR